MFKMFLLFIVFFKFSDIVELNLLVCFLTKALQAFQLLQPFHFPVLILISLLYAFI